jgi:hypothetical protein
MVGTTDTTLARRRAVRPLSRSSFGSSISKMISAKREKPAMMMMIKSNVIIPDAKNSESESAAEMRQKISSRKMRRVTSSTVARSCRCRF